MAQAPWRSRSQPPASGSSRLPVGPARQVARHVAGVKELSTYAWTVWTPENPSPSPFSTGVCLEPEGPAVPQPLLDFGA